MKRSGPVVALKSSSRLRICQLSAAITSQPRARPATAAHNTMGPPASGLGCGNGDGGHHLMAVVVDGAGRGGAFPVDRQVPDARILAAYGALRIAPELDLAEAHAEG